MPTTEEFVEAAWGAAPRFGLAPKAITLLSHSENVVCQVDLGDDERVAMRLHRPGYNSVAELQSEILWVKALSSAGVRVPSAVALDSDEFGADRHYLEVPVGEETRHIGVVRWVQGQPIGDAIEAGGAQVVSHYGGIGRVAAQIRAHHHGWPPPSGFERRTWDGDGFVGDVPIWGRFWEVPELSEPQRELFSQCRTALQVELAALPTTSDRFGLIHSDLHLGNLMADGDELTVIDFDDAGFGWFAHEIAVALHPVLDEPWEADARAAFLDGYRQVHPLDAIDKRLIDTFLTVRCLMLIGWLHARPELPNYEHFADLAAQAEAAAQRYLA